MSLPNLGVASYTKTIFADPGTQSSSTMANIGPDPNSPHGETEMIAISLSGAADYAALISSSSYSNAWFEVSYVDGAAGPTPAVYPGQPRTLRLDATTGALLTVPASSVKVNAVIENGVASTGPAYAVFNASFAKSYGRAAIRGTYSQMFSVAPGATFEGAVPTFTKSVSWQSVGASSATFNLEFSPAFITFTGAFVNALTGNVASTTILPQAHRFFKIANPGLSTDIVQICFQIEA